MGKEEYYAALDNERRVIGKASWKEVHEKGLLHAVVACFVFQDSSRRKILLQKRIVHAAQDPGLWNHSAGGHILYNELPQQGMRRELKEELFSGKPLPKIDIKPVAVFMQEDRPNNKEILYLFETTYKGPFHYDTQEIEEEPQWIAWDVLVRDIQVNPNRYTVSFKNSIVAYENAVLVKPRAV